MLNFGHYIQNVKQKKGKRRRIEGLWEQTKAAAEVRVLNSPRDRSRAHVPNLAGIHKPNRPPTVSLFQERAKQPPANESQHMIRRRSKSNV